MILRNLNAMCQNLNADRAMVAKIHGTTDKEGYISNDSAFSIMFEHCANNVISVKPLIQNIPVSVLKLEFGEDIDGIVVGDLKYAPHEKCTSHLKKLRVTVIINQLLRVEDYVWGVLSLHFKNRPSFVKEGKITEDFVPLLKNYKQSILTSNHENR